MEVFLCIAYTNLTPLIYLPFCHFNLIITDRLPPHGTPVLQTSMKSNPSSEVSTLFIRDDCDVDWSHRGADHQTLDTGYKCYSL